MKLVFDQETWVRFSVDGGPTRHGLFPAGSVESFDVENKIELRIGNAGGVKVQLDGAELPALGPSGRVVDLVLPGTAD